VTQLLCRHALLGLIILQPLWFFWLAPSQVLPPWLATAIMALPLVLALPGVWRARRNALVITGCILLLHFSVAVSETWATPAARLPAIIQIVLVVIYFTALSTLRWGRRSG